MDPSDERIASACGVSPAEAREIFRQAAEAHERIAESVEALYRPEAAENDGETQMQRVKRYLECDY